MQWLHDTGYPVYYNNEILHVYLFCIIQWLGSSDHLYKSFTKLKKKLNEIKYNKKQINIILVVKPFHCVKWNSLIIFNGTKI